MILRPGLIRTATLGLLLVAAPSAAAQQTYDVRGVVAETPQAKPSTVRWSWRWRFPTPC